MLPKSCIFQRQKCIYAHFLPFVRINMPFDPKKDTRVLLRRIWPKRHFFDIKKSSMCLANQQVGRSIFTPI